MTHEVQKVWFILEEGYVDVPLDGEFITTEQELFDKAEYVLSTDFRAYEFYPDAPHKTADVTNWVIERAFKVAGDPNAEHSTYHRGIGI